ncbi:unnamed protein product [Lactuca virosa]|uniref:Uncharacterized protein n=1 Tax=Lactuca virosa TaxID=75947 RepID=A0AAU9NTC2_9ASTR|nr:unnamed protein product [Lactuca virosa]
MQTKASVYTKRKTFTAHTLSVYCEQLFLESSDSSLPVNQQHSQINSPVIGPRSSPVVSNSSHQNLQQVTQQLPSIPARHNQQTTRGPPETEASTPRSPPGTSDSGEWNLVAISGDEFQHRS